MSPYVELFNLAKTYPSSKGEVVIVQNFNLTIAQGEFVTLIGHSGCGKSTVLSLVAGLNPLSRDVNSGGRPNLSRQRQCHHLQLRRGDQADEIRFSLRRTFRKCRSQHQFSAGRDRRRTGLR